MPNTIGLIGKKIGMTRIFVESGGATGVTVIESGPCVVLQVKTSEKDGYNAIQLGFHSKKLNKLTKPLIGHLKKTQENGLSFLKEFRVTNPDFYSLGQELKIGDVFRVGDLVDITGLSKGRGFQGVVKRHGFKGGRSTHGSMFHRAPGSIGCSAYPSRVIKGKKLPGQMGNKKITKKNCMIIDIKGDENLLIVKGGVPGSKNGIIKIHTKSSI